MTQYTISRCCYNRQYCIAVDNTDNNRPKQLSTQQTVSASVHKTESNVAVDTNDPIPPPPNKLVSSTYLAKTQRPWRHYSGDQCLTLHSKPGRDKQQIALPGFSARFTTRHRPQTGANTVYFPVALKTVVILKSKVSPQKKNKKRR